MEKSLWTVFEISFNFIRHLVVNECQRNNQAYVAYVAINSKCWNFFEIKRTKE